MRENLFANIGGAAEQVRVDIACQQHRLKKKNTGRPDRGGPSEKRQDHLADHGLANEKEKRAGEQRRCQDRNW